MPYPVIARTFRVALNWQDAAGSQHAVNVMHFRSTVDAVTPGEVAATIDAHVTRAMWQPVSSAFHVESLSIIALDGSSAAEEFGTAGAAKWEGPSDGDTIPQAAAIVKLTTALRGRSFRGRVFLPAVSEGVQVGGSIDGSTMDLWRPAWTAFTAAVHDDPDTPLFVCVASYKLAESQIVTLAQPEQETGTQRRRQTRNRGH